MKIRTKDKSPKVKDVENKILCSNGSRRQPGPAALSKPELKPAGTNLPQHPVVATEDPQLHPNCLLLKQERFRFLSVYCDISHLM